jgi:uracil-DNA glycosylase
MNEKLKEVQLKLHEAIKPSGWGNKLKLFVLSDDFYKILERLMIESNANKKFTPTIKHLFKAFEECPYDELKVVIVGQDPYPKEGVADGIAFSCSKTEHPSQVQPSLRYIHKALDAEGLEHFHTYNLKDWANQGILMLNTALTTTIGTPGAHTDLWEPFMKFLFEVLNEQKGLVYIFMGKVAQSWRSHINQEDNYIFTCSHPASAAYSQGDWYSNGVFKNADKIVKENFNYNIKW